MDPDIGSALNSERVSDLSIPSAFHLTVVSLHRPAEKTIDRLHVVFIAAIALISMAVFFYSALCLTMHIRCFDFRPVMESTVDFPAQPSAISFPTPLPGQQPLSVADT